MDGGKINSCFVWRIKGAVQAAPARALLVGGDNCLVKVANVLRVGKEPQRVGVEPNLRLAKPFGYFFPSKEKSCAFVV